MPARFHTTKSPERTSDLGEGRNRQRLSSLENGSRAIEFRMAGAVRMFTVDCK